MVSLHTRYHVQNFAERKPQAFFDFVERNRPTFLPGMEENF
jgi:hypothetical protein